MATITLTDQNISNTYTGVIHSQGEIMPSFGLVLLYDGGGNASSLRLGRYGEGATIHGPLSCSAFTSNGISYPIIDGTPSQFIKTNGSGTLTFGNISNTDLPDLVPNPASTYEGISAITVDTKGRVTNVKVSGGGSFNYSGVYMYVSPILLVTTTSKNYSEVVSVARSNMPDGVTFAILKIEMNSVAPPDQVTRTGELTVRINNEKTVVLGLTDWIYSENHEDNYVNNNHLIWYAAMDGSNNITVDVVDDGTSNLRCRTRVYLLGYATYTQLSNP